MKLLLYIQLHFLTRFKRINEKCVLIYSILLHSVNVCIHRLQDNRLAL